MNMSNKPSFVSDKDYQERLASLNRKMERFKQSVNLYNKLKENTANQVNKNLSMTGVIMEPEYYSEENASDFGKTLSNMKQLIDNFKISLKLMEIRAENCTEATPWNFMEMRTYDRIADKICSSILDLEEACGTLAQSAATAAKQLEAKKAEEQEKPKVIEKHITVTSHLSEMTDEDIETIINILEKYIKN